jgi:hypothetical protein
MKKRLLMVLVLAMLYALTTVQVQAAEMKMGMAPKMASPRLNAKTVGLKLALRDLWIGHIFWVRNEVLLTKLGNAEAAKVASSQVVENAKAIGNAIAPIYGQGAADKLFSLLAGHYSGVKEYMAAVYDGKKDGQDVALAKMKQNGDELATFLNSANPKNWPKDMILSALVVHVGHHMTQINQVNDGDYSGEANTWEQMKKHIYAIADVLADGIVKQFPKKF